MNMMQEGQDENKTRAPSIIEFIILVMMFFAAFTALKGCKDHHHGPRTSQGETDGGRHNYTQEAL